MINQYLCTILFPVRTGNEGHTFEVIIQKEFTVIQFHEYIIFLSCLQFDVQMIGSHFEVIILSLG